MNPAVGLHDPMKWGENLVPRLLLILSLCIFNPLAHGLGNNDLRSNWLELAGKVDVGYKKALQCEAGAVNSDRSTCKDFAAYMKLAYTRIAYLSSTVDQLPMRQLQQIATPREYEDYKVKLNKIAEVSSSWGE